MKKVYFPPEVFPVSAVITNLVTLCLSLFVLVPFLIAYKIQPTGKLWCLPGIILWQTFFCCGLGMLLALSQVYFRDTGPLMDIILNLWFFATPVFYTTDSMPEKIKFFYYLNPAAVMVDLYRWSILSLPFPSVFHLTVWAGVTVAFLMLGFRIYIRRGSHVANIL